MKATSMISVLSHTNLVPHFASFRTNGCQVFDNFLVMILLDYLLCFQFICSSI